MAGNLYDALLGGLDREDRLLLTDETVGTMSYRAFADQCARLAGALLEAGLQPGDRVAVQAEKSVAALALYLATVRAGGIYLPLNIAYTPAEIEYFLTDAEPSIFVCDPSRFEALQPIAKAAGAKILTLDLAGKGTLTDAAAIATPITETSARGGADIAAILYTSGTTGRSKGAMLSHDNLLSNAVSLVESWRFTDKDVLIHALPIFHTHGLFVGTNVVLASRASMIFQAKFDPNKIMEAMPKATVLMGVPTFYTRLLQHSGLDRDSTAHMRLFVSGSAPLLAETHEEWQARTGHAILERYGMTETNMNTSNPYDGRRVAGTVGFPLPGVQVRVTDAETGASLGTEEIGMIEVRGPNVFSGYWRMPEKTAAEFRKDGFFITGDLGKIDKDGYVHIVGRGKDLIITGGYNVYPKEVEMEIDAMPGVIESAVFGVKHPDFGEGIIAAIVLKSEAQLTEQEVIKALDGRLAGYKRPKKVAFMTELPRNTMGKVQKNILRNQFSGTFEPTAAAAK
ncbi:malonate--CoA ligase [Neorhizobium galegae]|uniref:malonate--CoA ligase n=1 Tax=Neorhizobium galegae TaxID=399 RepID=UPI000622511D|nr:malonyl-CoA synthase [Neorhizobium galegae]MCQ1852085.1 malonyl-CoA synthase [Neorhizobium galegae]CDZ43572.1 Malonyl-CoA synthase [Neorhizobium galegae bv. orientalis]